MQHIFNSVLLSDHKLASIHLLFRLGIESEYYSRLTSLLTRLLAEICLIFNRKISLFGGFCSLNAIDSLD